MLSMYTRLLDFNPCCCFNPNCAFAPRELPWACMKREEPQRNRRRAVKRKVPCGGLPFDRSIGYQVRATHRLLQRYLQIKIEPFGIMPGAWYFLRALWHEDGLTQRELSQRIGTAEPTALTAINAMEAQGLVRRVRSEKDKRKVHVWLTPRAKRLERRLIPLAREVVATAAITLNAGQVDHLLKMLTQVQQNLSEALELTDRKSARSGLRLP
jgi:MarR family transcriptional regulator, organic hydroperoxide resistance regulator